jgi:hypothetical protein
LLNVIKGQLAQWSSRASKNRREKIFSCLENLPRASFCKSEAKSSDAAKAQMYFVADDPELRCLAKLELAARSA